MTNGMLYIVSTPLGNLEDITLRSIRILKEVDFILCEDTRHSGVLLKHLEIHKPLKSLHDHTPMAKIEEIVNELEQGKTAALISDAGTPVISDPGFPLIRACIERNIKVEALPGPCAVINALVLSGLAPHAFSFLGYLPPKQKGRCDRLNEVKHETRTLIFYESPYRILKSLEDIAQVLGDRRISVSREMTKKFEETFRGTVSQALAHFSAKKILGEFVLVVAGESEKTERNHES